MLKIGTIYKWTASDNWLYDCMNVNDIIIKHNDIFLLLDHVIETIEIVKGKSSTNNILKILYENKISYIKILSSNVEQFVETIC